MHLMAFCVVLCDACVTFWEKYRIKQYYNYFWYVFIC